VNEQRIEIDVPHSICECGHFNSVHEGAHGRCEVCECKRFTWADFAHPSPSDRVIQKGSLRMQRSNQGETG
jgi:uncharacterized membrane protein